MNGNMKIEMAPKIAENMVEILIEKYQLVDFKNHYYQFENFLIEVDEKIGVVLKFKLGLKIKEVANVVCCLADYSSVVKFDEWKIYRGGKSDMWFKGCDAVIEYAADTLINNLGADQAVSLIEDFDLRDKCYGSEESEVLSL